MKIALTAEHLGSRTATFLSHLTLRDMLTTFIESGFLPADTLQRSPVVVYLRQQFFTLCGSYIEAGFLSVEASFDCVSNPAVITI